MSLNCLIIDDEPLAHKVILEYARELPFLNISGQCYKAIEAYELLRQKKVDLLFLDINMPLLKGLDFLRTLNRPPRVIITSAYEEYALESFDLQVSDYLLKPFRFERFLKAVNKVRREMGAGQEADIKTEQPATRKATIFLKVDKRHLQVQLTEIHFLESFGNYVKVWIGDKFHLTARTLTSFVEELDAVDFVRVHKSFVIQKRHLAYLEGFQLVMKNGQRVPIGKHYRQGVKNWVR